MISNPTDPSNPDDVILVEIDYYPVEKPGKANNMSGIWIGYETQSGDFYWSAMSDTTKGGGQ